MHYEYDWIVTFEVIAENEKEAQEKKKKFKEELYARYAETPDIWLTNIRLADG